MRGKRAHIPLVLATALAVAPTPAHAGPIVVRDDLLKDLAITPALGRGYSLSTNTFQSICLQGIVKTKPSYNFYYKFSSEEEAGSSTSAVSMALEASRSVEAKEGAPVGGGMKQSIAAKTSIIDGVQYSNHSMRVRVEIEVYYASIDEAASKISESAKELLVNRDIPGFFDGCGSYYIRSLNRRGSFDSKLSYKTKSTSRDFSFEAKLEFELKAVTPVAEATSSVKVAASTRFASEASEKQLTIESTAFGLGKDENASLVAYDIESFKKAIGDAFKSMQNDDVGMVTSMEVVPWVENVEFQRWIKLYEPKPSPIPGAPPVSPYAQKRILNLNGEFLSEVDRSARARLVAYIRSKMCQMHMDTNWRTSSGTWKKPFVINFKTGAKTKADDFYKKFTEADPKKGGAHPDVLFENYRKFLFGDGQGGGGPPLAPLPPPVPKVGQDGKPILGPDGKPEMVQPARPPPTTVPAGAPSAVLCMRDLLNSDITVTTFREVGACKLLEKELPVATPMFLNEECMPTLVD